MRRCLAYINTEKRFDNYEQTSVSVLHQLLSVSAAPYNVFACLANGGRVAVFATNTSALPIAHTCSKQIELPKYSSKEVLEKRLKTAITWATDFAGMG